jgi:hypothetical protein
VCALWSAAFAGPASGLASAAGTDAGERTREIEALVQRADFDVAERAARKLLQSGSLSGQEVARVYLQLGIIASAKRDSASAAAAFRDALRLDGDLTLRPSAGPHVTETFSRVKSAMPETTAREPAITLSAAADRGELIVEAAAQPSNSPAHQVSVQIAEVKETRKLGAAPIRFSLSLPASVDRCVTARASVLDEFGNELWPAASQDVCRAPAAPRPPAVSLPSASLMVPPKRESSPNVLSTTALTAPSATARPISRLTWMAAALTGAAAAATGVLGVVALERRDDYHDSFGGSASLDQQQHLRDLAVRAEQRATVGAVVTGALLAATAILYVRSRF